jgi:hypothetical protein
MAKLGEDCNAFDWHQSPESVFGSLTKSIQLAVMKARF